MTNKKKKKESYLENLLLRDPNGFLSSFAHLMREQCIACAQMGLEKKEDIKKKS